METTTILTFAGILACLSQSAMLSGLNLAYFSLNKLELQVNARKGSARARRVLALRDDANFALVTILWGNVAVNVLLALLAGSVLTGFAAFLFSTVVITLFAEIAPQAWFSRHALQVASRFAPVLRAYQILLYPVAKPTAWVLDRWLGKEAVRYYPERDLRELIRLHMDSASSDIARVEGQGALNFLALDDVPFAEEGEDVDPDSVLELPFRDGQPVFPAVLGQADDEFLRAVHRSGRKWIVLVDQSGTPRLVLNADDFLRDALLDDRRISVLRHCHRPIVTTDERTRLGELLPRLRVQARHSQDDVVDEDVILLWSGRRRLITGADVLGRLLRGIARVESVNVPDKSVSAPA